MNLKHKLQNSLAIITLLSGSLFATATAQTAPNWQWRAIAPASAVKPDARRNGALIFDPVGQRLILFGGTGDSGLLNDTWAFGLDSNTWTKLTTTGTPPPARFAFDAVYDPVGQQLVVYSGQGAGFFNDTWTLNLTTLAWRDVSPANEAARPKRRYGSAGIFDPVSRSLVSFAGFTSEAGRFQDSQSFSLANNAWTDWTPSGVKPQIRCLLTGAYDSKRRRQVIYAGQRNGALDDLWAFDLATRTWTDLTPATRPPARWFASSFIDAADSFLIFGGQGAATYDDLWSFSFASGQWTRLNAPNGPAARFGALNAYDAANNRWFIFGGSGNSTFNDLWELRTVRQPSTVAAASAASYSGERLSAESIATIFGTELTTTTQAATTLPLPTTLQNLSVRVKDSLSVERTAPLFFISPTQINFLVPPGTANGSASLGVYDGATLIANGSTSITTIAPGVFTANADGRGAPAAVLLRVAGNGAATTESLLSFDNATNRWVSRALDLGSEQDQVYLILFGTGLRGHSGLSSVTATIGGTAAPVSYAGAQGNFAGLDQVNVRIPRSLVGRGDVAVEINVGSLSTNSLRITVK